jgi:hypothetical protein
MLEGFGWLKDLSKIEQKVAEIQARLSERKVTASAGGGMVKVVCNGKKEVVDIRIEQDVANDIEMLQDLLLSAIAEAQKKAGEIFSEEISAFTGGLISPKIKV